MDFANLGTIFTSMFAVANLVLTSWWKLYSDRKARDLGKRLDQEKADRQQQYHQQIIRLQDELEQRREQQSRAYLAQQLMRTYQDPLLRSAVDLQSRLFNILRLHLLDRFYNQGTEAEQEYTIENTLYVIAEYLGWVEIIRREVQFIDLGSDEVNRTLIGLTDSVSEAFLRSELPGTFRIFRGEQRAIGEIMMTYLPSEEGPYRRECIGYGTFLEMQEKPGFSRWFRKLRDDIKELAQGAGDPVRLVRLQNALVDLIGHLDPGGLKCPLDRRTRVAAGEVDVP